MQETIFSKTAFTFIANAIFYSFSQINLVNYIVESLVKLAESDRPYFQHLFQVYSNIQNLVIIYSGFFTITVAYYSFWFRVQSLTKPQQNAVELVLRPRVKWLFF